MNRRVAILTSKVQAEVPQRLLEEADAIGLPVDIIDILSPDWTQQLNQAEYSYVVARIGPQSYETYDTSLGIVREDYRAMIQSAMRAFNKADSFHILNAAGLPHPHTWIVSPDNIKNQVMPIVVKRLLGHQGRGVFLVTNEAQSAQMYQQVAQDSAVIVQEFIRYADRLHKRLFVVGDKVAASMTRRGPEGDFRSNAKGNIGTIYYPTPEESAMAVEATKVHGLMYAGVDIIDSERGPLVLEVNPSPGLTIENYSKTNVAAQIVANLA